MKSLHSSVPSFAVIALAAGFACLHTATRRRITLRRDEVLP